MSSKGNYEPNYDLESINLLKHIANDLSLEIRSNFFDNIVGSISYSGEYKNYDIIIQYEPIKRYYLRIVLSRNGYNHAQQFAIETIKFNGVEWCIGYMAHDLEKNINI